MRYILRQSWDIRMFRALLGHTTSEAYEKWAGQEKQEVLTDILPEEARLHWFGPRRDATQGRVLLFYGALRLSTFLHIRSLKLGLKLVLFLFFSGGGFSLPPRSDYFSFLHALHDSTTFRPCHGTDDLTYSVDARVPFPNPTEAS